MGGRKTPNVGVTMEAEWIFMLVSIVIFVLISIVCYYLRGQHVRERQIFNDLLLDGYDVKIYPLADPGRGRYVVRIWRSNRWTEVER